MKAAAVVDSDRADRARKRPRPKAGMDSQRRRREAERIQQTFVCRLARRLLETGADWAAIQLILGVGMRTIHRWMIRMDSPLVPRGRPPENVAFQLWCDLYTFMRKQGEKTGEPTLRRRFPTYPPGALRRDMRRVRRILKNLRKKITRRLNWTRAGAVWAMDFGVAPKGEAGCVKDFLVVRDLASRFTLSAKAVEGQDAASTIEELTWLFSYYGRPMVIKADNGPAFISWEMRNFLKEAGVYLMLSPVRRPSYNGGVENAVNEVKEYAEHRAALHGRHYWTQEDLSWARDRANRIVGADKMDRLERSQTGTPITEDEREDFHDAYRARKATVRRNMEDTNTQKLTRKQQTIADRRALRNALVGSGFLRIEGATFSSE